MRTHALHTHASLCLVRWLSVLAACLAWLLCGSARAQAPEGVDAAATPPAADVVGQGSVLRSFELTCDLPQCGDDAFRARVLGVTGVSAGSRVTTAQLQRAYGFVMDTTYFARCTPSERWTAEGVFVALDCEGATLIRDVDVRAGLALGSEIQQRVFLRGGQPWTGDDERTQRQIREIEEYFEDRGFFGTSVNIEVEPVEPFVVDLTFRIDRGSRASVDQVYLRGQSTLSYDELRDTILGEFNLVRTFTAERFERAQAAVQARYRELGYIQARVTLDEFRLDQAAETVDLFLEVREGVRWDVRFVGNRLFSRDQLLSALAFYQTGFVDDAEIENAVDQIRALYETVGHVFVDIDVRQPPTSDGTRALYFDIREQQTSEIREVRLEGVTVFRESALLRAMQTRPYDILSTGGYLQRSRLDNDIRAIVALYESAGYLDATVSRVVFVGDQNGRDLYVTLHIEEGLPSTIAGIRVEGVAQIDALERSLRRRRRRADRAREEGTPPTQDAYSTGSVVQDEAALVAAMQEEGFQEASVTSRCHAVREVVDGRALRGIEVDCPRPRARPPRLSVADDRTLACARERRGARVVEECRLHAPLERVPPESDAAASDVVVVYDIDLGRSVSLGDWFIRGNFLTRARIIERELQFERGELFRYGALLEAQSRLRASGLFDSVRLRTIGDGDDPRSAAHVLVQLEERDSRSFEHRVSTSARIAAAENFQLVLSNQPIFRDINIAGSGSELLVFGQFDVDVLEPERLRDGEFRASAGIAYIDPRLYLSRRMTDPWEWVNAVTYTYDLLALPPAPLTKELAFRTQVREEFDAIEGLFFGLELSVRQTQTLDQSDAAVATDVFEPAFILSLTPRVTYEGRDNPLNPTRGVFSELEIELADDFLGVLDSSRFTKVSTRTSVFVPLGDHFVAGANARFGVAVGGILNGFRSNAAFALPLSERFRLGGVTTLRGFAEGEITSTDVDDFGGDVVLGGNLELRYPFVRSLNLDGAVFLDVGQLARDVDELRADGFRTAGGFGVRWVIADLIPLVFDYGAVLNRQPGERFGRFHLNIGYTF